MHTQSACFQNNTNRVWPYFFKTPRNKNVSEAPHWFYIIWMKTILILSWIVMKLWNITSAPLQKWNSVYIFRFPHKFQQFFAYLALAFNFWAHFEDQKIYNTENKRNELNVMQPKSSKAPLITWKVRSLLNQLFFRHPVHKNVLKQFKEMHLVNLCIWLII